MNLEEMQKAWQSQHAAAKVTVNADLLLQVVRRSQQQFRATILLRDLREVAVAFILTGFFAWRGLRHDDWTDLLVGFACFGVGAFMIVDRLRQRRHQPSSNDPLKTCLEASLHQVKHQIWLLRNVWWWYILPIAASITVSTVVSAWHTRAESGQLLFWAFYMVICFLIYGGVYRINQFAVRRSLEPRRQELEALLASLD